MEAKKLKVLHTMTWLAPGGGVDKNVYLSISGMRHEFDFHLAVGKTIYQNEFQHIEGLPIHVCPHLERELRPWKDLKSLIWFYRLIRREKYDVVHTHETKASLISRVAAWMAGCNYIIYGLHGVTFNDPLSKMRRLIYIWVEKLTIWMNDYLVSVSQDTLDIYHAHKLARKIPCEVAYSGIDTIAFTETKPSTDERATRRAALGFAADDLVLINIGRFSFSKAQRYTIASFSELRNSFPHAKLLLVGDGELIEDCKKQVADLGLQDAVVFYGFCEDVASVLYLADVLVLTSLREGLPRVVVEAALCGLPTVAFEVEGIREAIPQLYHHYIVPQTDTEALTKQLTEILRDGQVREAYARMAFTHAQHNWDYRQMNKTLARIYREQPKRK